MSPRGPFRVQYYCPRQGQYWQDKKGAPLPTLRAAVTLALVIKPPRGAARVLDATGAAVFEV